MNSAAIEFGELPPRGDTSPLGKGQPGKHRQIADRLRQSPGEWARIDTRPTVSAAGCMVHQIKTAYYKAYAPKGTYEAAARTVDGKHQVWARYIGEEDEYA